MQTVYVGLSGGVDSAVSAMLLREQGYRVVGAFIKIWQPEFIECTWREDRLDAMRVCAMLRIPFKEIDLSAEYKNAVVERMVSVYKSGKTPNPDVLCNREIKFGPFMRWAFSEGADYVATGHYARVKKICQDDILTWKLLRGKDKDKDQSYFLYRLERSELERILFPVGEMEKREVRALAEKYGLPVMHKKDSQGLCFVGDITLPEFLARYIETKKGDVLDESGGVVGFHDGAMLYTKGQRHGFTLTGNATRTPRYVIATNVAANTITVSARAARAETERILVDVHWIDEAPALPADFSVQARYRETPVEARISREAERYVVAFTRPHLASPGQSLVVYDGDECLGGGDIAME